MRSLSLSIAALAALVLAACGGASGKQVTTARQTRYQGDQLQLFAAAKAAAEEKYKLQKSDETTLGFQTEARWYNPDGQSISSNISDLRDAPDQSLLIAFVVQLVLDDPHYAVHVTPMIQRYHKGRPNPDVVDPKDPSLPGWALGKAENLEVAIHEALKQYAVAASSSSADPGLLPEQAAGMPEPPPDPATNTPASEAAPTP